MILTEAQRKILLQMKKHGGYTNTNHDPTVGSILGRMAQEDYCQRMSGGVYIILQKGESALQEYADRKLALVSSVSAAVLAALSLAATVAIGVLQFLGT